MHLIDLDLNESSMYRLKDSILGQIHEQIRIDYTETHILGEIRGSMYEIDNRFMGKYLLLLEDFECI